MKIPTMIRYGVRMVVMLAQERKIMNTVELASSMGVSSLYLRQLALPLEKMGIIRGFRGPKGGYLLAVNPEEITMFEIIQAFDEDFCLLECIENPDSCAQSVTCTSRHLWKDVSELIQNTLKNTTLNDLLHKERWGNEEKEE